MSENAIDLSPFCMRARGFLAQGRTEDAFDLYGDVLKVDPDNALAYADRGTAYAMLKKFDFALHDLERAFALGYGEASAYSTAGTIYFELKQFDKALGCFAKAVDLDPSYPLTYYNRSSVLVQLGKTQSAIEDLEKCLGFNPGDDLRQLIAKRLNALRV